jgi:hypothetical protein
VTDAGQLAGELASGARMAADAHPAGRRRAQGDGGGGVAGPATSSPHGAMGGGAGSGVGRHGLGTVRKKGAGWVS